jgi:hypothetical protein
VTIQAHANAVLALLNAASGTPALTVLDGSVPQGTNRPYVLVYLSDRTPGAADAADSTPLQGDSDRLVTTVYCHCVGADAIAARAVAQRVRGALLNVTPAIAGRVCWPIRSTEDQPPQRDETTGPVVMDLVSMYRLESVPAT